MRFLRALILFLLLIGLGAALERYQSIFGGKRIAVVHLDGVITSKTPDSLIPLLREALNRNDIAGIILRIDSPGGAVAPSQELYRFIVEHRKDKPIYASIGTVGASGAYYVASACDKIYADAGSLVGSIGVIFTFSEFRELLKKVGIKPVVLKSGRFKDVGSPFREMTPEEREYIKGLLDEIHRQFVEDVAKGRNLPVEKVREVADGRVFTGERAQELSLVDGVRSFWEVVGILSKDLGYKRPLETVELRKKRSIWGAFRAQMVELVRDIKTELLEEGIR